LTGIVGSAFLLAKKLFSAKPAKPELVSRADFYTEMLATRERLHANHLAILEKLDANHRELLAALERQATRINALECGLARVDERTRKQGGRASTRAQTSREVSGSEASPAWTSGRGSREGERPREPKHLGKSREVRPRPRG